VQATQTQDRRRDRCKPLHTVARGKVPCTALCTAGRSEHRKLPWASVLSLERRARAASTTRLAVQASAALAVELRDALSAGWKAGTGSSIGRTGPTSRRRLKLATKKQKARAAGAGTNLPTKAKPKKKTSRGK